jgi:hypothetical protein
MIRKAIFAVATVAAIGALPDRGFRRCVGPATPHRAESLLTLSSLDHRRESSSRRA